MLRQPCVARQCLKVVVFKSEVYVVAPESQRCTYDDLLVGQCSPFARQQTEGLAANYEGARGGKWDTHYSPSSLRWHFAAGVNVSTCASSIRPGDFNGVFTRLRLVTSLRLIEEAARAGTLSDTELILCLQETPLNAGGWCLGGSQPIFAMVTNEEAPMLAFPHWLPRFRDVDFAFWDGARRAESKRSAFSEKPPEHRARKAVFRGGIYRLSVYSDRWRKKGCRRTLLTSSNWKHLGRSALLHTAMSDAANILDANVFVGPYTERLGLNESLLAKMSAPPFLSLAEQTARFRYVLNIEGHGGWADRLPKLLLSSMLVLNQDQAPRLWFESVLRQFETHLVVDSNLRNLSEVVKWAQHHDSQAQTMVERASEAMEAVLSLDGIRSYVRELITKYTTKLLARPPERLPARAVRFSCRETGRLGSCRTPDRELSPRQTLQGTHCYFSAPRGRGAARAEVRYDTLHDAAEALFGSSKARATSSSSPSSAIPNTTEALAAARASICSATHRTDARARGKWCFDFRTRSDCESHSVAGGHAGCRRRACVWRPSLHAFGLETDNLCSLAAAGERHQRAAMHEHVAIARLASRSKRAGLSRSTSASACVAVCPCAALCNATNG